MTLGTTNCNINHWYTEVKYYTVMKAAVTKNMIEILRHCQERELLNLEPYDVSTIRSATELIKRGMLMTKPYIAKNGKKILALYLTKQGKTYVSNI